MWYWDFAPPSGHHRKKPLTRAQIQKLQSAYASANAITESVKKIEEEEQQRIQEEIQKNLNLLL